MILPVYHQGVLFLGTVAAGFVLAFLYDIFRVARRIVPHKPLFIHIEDFIYWVVVIAAVFGLLFVLNNGSLRFFAIAGVFAGMLSYFVFVSPIFLKFSMAIYELIRTVVLFAVSVIMAPFRLLARILSGPAGVAKRKANELYRYERRIYTGIKIRGKSNSRKFRNNLSIIFKKI